MKTSLLLFSLILIISGINGQIVKPITKGNFQFGGNVNLSYNKTKSDDSYNGFKSQLSVKSFYFSFNPSIGYFFVNNFVIGLQPSFSYSYSSNQTFNDYFFFGIGPYLKYYHNSGILASLNGSFVYVYGKSTNSIIQYSHEPKYTSKNWEISPGVGYSFFLNSKISLELIISYDYLFGDYLNDVETNRDNQLLTINSLKFGTGFSLFF